MGDFHQVIQAEQQIKEEPAIPGILELENTDSFTTESSEVSSILSKRSTFRARNKAPSILSFLIVTNARTKNLVQQMASTKDSTELDVSSFSRRSKVSKLNQSRGRSTERDIKLKNEGKHYTNGLTKRSSSLPKMKLEAGCNQGCGNNNHDHQNNLVKDT